MNHQTQSRTADNAIGVVIPVYNRRSILLETLPHVLKQTHLPTALTIVDDGSTDDTPDAAEQFLTQVQPAFAWQVIRSQHGSAAYARQEGYKTIADLPYVAFLDSDDHWPADFLERGLETLQANPQASAASSDRYYTDAEGVLHGEDDLRPMTGGPIPWFFHNGAGVASCTLLRAAAYQRAGGWKPELLTAEDVELFSQVALQGEWLHMPGDPVAFNLGNATARNEENNLSRRFINNQDGWAQVYESIYDFVVAARPEIDRRPLHLGLAYRWCAAGKQNAQLGSLRRARECYKRSLFWKPTHFRSWRRLATTSFSRDRAA